MSILSPSININDTRGHRRSWPAIQDSPQAIVTLRSGRHYQGPVAIDEAYVVMLDARRRTPWGDGTGSLTAVGTMVWPAREILSIKQLGCGS